MSMHQILETIRTFDGVLELAPAVGSEFPELAWGDHYFYYAPDGQVPQREQPYATIVTKNYPEDVLSDLDAADRWRLNIHVGRRRFVELTGEDPGSEPGGWDHTAADTLTPHPRYRAQGWIAIVNPGERTTALALTELRASHERARMRARRRAADR